MTNFPIVPKTNTAANAKTQLALRANINFPKEDTAIESRLFSAVRDEFSFWGSYVSTGSLEWRDSQGCTPLLRAVKASNLKSVQHYVKLGANIYARDNNGYGVLHNFSLNIKDYEYKNDHIKIVKYLLEHGANVNAEGQFKRTPLHAWVQNYEVVEHLLLKGANIHARNSYGAAILHEAMSQNAPLETVKLLVENEADVNAITNSTKSTPLHFLACKDERCLPVMQYMIEQGANIRTKNSKGENVVKQKLYNIQRLKKLDMDVLSLLLSHGADIFEPDNGGFSIVAELFAYTKGILKHFTDFEILPGDQYCNVSSGIQVGLQITQENFEKFISLLNLENLEKVEKFIFNLIKFEEDKKPFVVEEAARVVELTEEGAPLLPFETKPKEFITQEQKKFYKYLEKVQNSKRTPYTPSPDHLKLMEEERIIHDKSLEPLFRSKSVAEMNVNLLNIFLKQLQTFIDTNLVALTEEKAQLALNTLNPTYRPVLIRRTYYTVPKENFTVIPNEPTLISLPSNLTSQSNNISPLIQEEEKKKSLDKPLGFFEGLFQNIIWLGKKISEFFVNLFYFKKD